MNQTAYKKVSCADAIFAMQEVIARYVNNGNEVFMCLYDLQKAFDSVEFPVLLSRLHEAGVGGKTLRILKDWYDRGKCKVKVDGRLSEEFPVEWGVKQGSVLSPTFFLLVMDPLLKQLQASAWVSHLTLRQGIPPCCRHQDLCIQQEIPRIPGSPGGGFCHRTY